MREGERRVPRSRCGSTRALPRRPGAARRGARRARPAASGSRSAGSRRCARRAGRPRIQREWGKRRIVVQANVRGRDLGGFVAEVQRTLAAEVELPRRAPTLRYGGQFEHLERARARLARRRARSRSRSSSCSSAHLPARRSTRCASSPACRSRWSAASSRCWLRGMPFSISAAVGFVALVGRRRCSATWCSCRAIRQLRDEGLAARGRGARGGAHAPAAGAHDGGRRGLGFVPMALNTGRRRRGAAAARDGGHRRRALLDAAHAARAAGALHR